MTEVLSLPEDPGDFNQKWKRSNAVLYCKNSDKPLHVQVEVLAKHSPEFRKNAPNEKTDYVDIINIDEDYDVVKEVMRIIHDDNNNTLPSDEGRSGMEQCAFLFSIKAFAERNKFSFVAKLCFEELKLYLTEMAYAAILHQNKSDLLLYLVKMSSDQIHDLLELSDSSLFFSKNDVVLFFYALTGIRTLDLQSSLEVQLLYLKSIFCAVEEEKPAKTPQKLTISPSITEELQKKRDDCDMIVEPRFDNRGNYYYANSEILTKYSSYFAMTRLLEETMHKNNMEFERLEVDVDYSTFGYILDFCERYREGHPGHMHPDMTPSSLCDAYLSCAQGRLQMPIIRHFCVKALGQLKNTEALDAAIKLDLQKVKSKILENISPEDLTAWISADEKDYSYMRAGKEVVLSSTGEDLILSLDDMRIVVDKLIQGCKGFVEKKAGEIRKVAEGARRTRAKI